MIDNIVTVITVLISAVALYFATRKQGHEEGKIDSEKKKAEAEEANIDADTIKTLYGLIREQEQRYKDYRVEQEGCYAQLTRDFEAYKVSTNAQIAAVVSENDKLRRWARKLAAQLEQAGIVPVTYEL